MSLEKQKLKVFIKFQQRSATLNAAGLKYCQMDVSKLLLMSINFRTEQKIKMQVFIFLTEYVCFCLLKKTLKVIVILVIINSKSHFKMILQH